MKIENVSELSEYSPSITHYSDLVDSCAILALNVSVLASKIFTRIPQIIGRSAQTALCYTGLLCLNIQVRDLRKTASDLSRAIKVGDKRAFIATAAKIANDISNIFLTLGGGIAAVLSLANYGFVALALYNIMAPWGVAATFLSVGLDLCRYTSHQDLLRQLEKIEEDKTHESLRKLFGHLINREDRLAAAIIRVLDGDTWKGLKQRFSHCHDLSTQKQLFHTLVDYCQKWDHLTVTDLALRALGYLSMAICRAFPDTLIQSSIYTGMSALYTAKLARQKYIEAVIREKINGSKDQDIGIDDR